MPIDIGTPARMAPGFAEPEMLLDWTVDGEDGIRRRAFLYHPGGKAPVPLVMAPHPFGFTALGSMFGEPAGPRTLCDVPGIAPAARRAGAAALVIQSEGRRYTGMSTGLPAQLTAYRDALRDAVDAGLPIDINRVVAAGLSMGGQESLLLAATLGDTVAAVAAQNPVTDPAAWYCHLAKGGAHHAHALRDEVGAEPELDPSAWSQRSPLAHVAALAGRGVPVQLRLNDVDNIVPAREQGRVFADALQQAGGIVEVVEDLPPLDDRDPGRSAHEHADWDAMLQWLLSRSVAEHRTEAAAC
ncbi:alpha/beta hydrolase family protein [Arthrobacter sp. 92]|uniref:alpha/beta hydrolase family protein n=1 Tax=Arthrobacter sp. 92 TaxID=3418175 RepID=UPI003CFF3466